MKQKTRPWTFGKAFNSLIVILLIFTTVTAPLTSTVSYAQYVLNPVEYSITVNSGSTYPITAIDTISGTPQLGSTLTAGVLTPSSATATYQWQKSDTHDGTYENIPGAISDTYTPSGSDYGCYLRVEAKGTGSYSGTVISPHIGPIEAGQVTAIGAIDGTAAVGRILTAGTVTPAEATVVYQWQRSNAPEGPFAEIPSATTDEYELTVEDFRKYIRVKATGIGNYTGSAISMHRGPVEAALITGIEEIEGTAQVGSILTAGTLTQQKRQLCINGREAMTLKDHLQIFRRPQAEPTS
jgi:hypothetical protein